MAHGIAIVAISFLTIDAGYLFEGVGIPLGRYEFGSRALTTACQPGMELRQPEPLFDIVWKFRVNRFRNTWLAEIPCPLPEHYVLGFDEQKIETEGIPTAGRMRAADRAKPADDVGQGASSHAHEIAVRDPDEKATGLSGLL